MVNLRMCSRLKVDDAAWKELHSNEPYLPATISNVVDCAGTLEGWRVSE